MSELQQTFLHNEIWIMTYSGAFQRANVYKHGTTEKKRAVFKVDLKEHMSKNILPQYKNSVSEDIHVLNIKNIMDFSEKWNEILNHGKLNVGVSQKLLNLALKYFWCLGDVAMPPHCPVDRIIQEVGMKSENIVNWTAMTEMEEYLAIIHSIEILAKVEGQSIAEWELQTFNRYNQ